MPLNALLEQNKPAQEAVLKHAWQQVKTAGLLIVHEDLVANKQTLNSTDLNGILEKFGEVQSYSSIVSSKIQDEIDVSHYSSIQESRLVEEKRDQAKVFRVVQKNT